MVRYFGNTANEESRQLFQVDVLTMNVFLSPSPRRIGQRPHYQEPPQFIVRQIVGAEFAPRD